MAPGHGDAANVGVIVPADREALQFEVALRPLIDDALRLACGMLLDSSEAEDAVQDACLRAWRSRQNRRPGTDLRPWFLAIVANQCREVRRGRWWRLARTAEPPAVAGPNTELSAASLDLRKALSRLPTRMRLVIVLRFYLDLPFESVATVAGCSVDAAKALVRRGTAQLARALEREG